MARFLLLLSRAQGGAAGRRAVRFAEWVADGASAGTIHGGGRLEPGGVRVDRGEGVTTVHDVVGGPGGYLLIEAEDLRAAMAVASSCPGGEPGSIEIRAVDPEAALA